MKLKLQKKKSLQDRRLYRLHKATQGPKAPQPKAPQPKAQQPKAPQPKALQPKAPQPKAPLPASFTGGASTAFSAAGLCPFKEQERILT